MLISLVAAFVTVSVASLNYPAGADEPSDTSRCDHDKKHLTYSFANDKGVPHWATAFIKGEFRLDKLKLSFILDKDIAGRFLKHASDYQDVDYVPTFLLSPRFHCSNAEICESFRRMPTNVVPMHHLVAESDWPRVDNLISDIIDLEVEKLHTLAGTLYMANENLNGPGNARMTLDVLESGIIAPTHFFRVISGTIKGEQYSTTVMVPNKPSTDASLMSDLVTDAETIELYAGLDLSGVKAAKSFCELIDCAQTFSSKPEQIARLAYGISLAGSLDNLKNDVSLALNHGLFTRRVYDATNKRVVEGFGLTDTTSAFSNDPVTLASLEQAIKSFSARGRD